MCGGSLLLSAVTPSITVVCDFSLSVDLTITDFAPFLSIVTLDGIGGCRGASKLRHQYRSRILMVIGS